MVTKTNLKKLIYRCNKATGESIVEWIGDVQTHFDSLMNIVYLNDLDHSMRAAWVIDMTTDRNIQLFEKHIERVIINLERFKHTGVVRCMLRILCKIEIHEKYWTTLFDLILKWLTLPETPLAVKVHGMQVCFNICEKVPELSNELKMILEDQFDKNTVGFKSRARKLIKKLDEMDAM